MCVRLPKLIIHYREVVFILANNFGFIYGLVHIGNVFFSIQMKYSFNPLLHFLFIM